MDVFGTVLAFLAVLVVLVLVHELGHFIAAKRAGITVQEFGIGFPPRITSVVWHGTRYSLNWIPLGGFVKMLGEDGDSEAQKMRERGLLLLASLGLAEHANKRPNQLSGGQRQRVAIARALANRPEIIVADEPTGALDTTSTEQVFSILRDIADKGQTVVVVTHDPALAARADRRVHIIDGKIAEITGRREHELLREPEVAGAARARETSDA